MASQGRSASGRPGARVPARADGLLPAAPPGGPTPADLAALGAVAGLGPLGFSEAAHVFWLAGRPCSLAEVRRLDACGLVSWRFLEHRDWMRRLDAPACDAAYEEACARAAAARGPAAALDEQIRRHVRKDDSYLHGRIVETDAPADPGRTAPSEPRFDTGPIERGTKQ